MAVLHRLVHPHVVQFVAWYESRNHIWMVVEYCAGGDLRSLIAADGPLSEHVARLFAWDVAQGLRALHTAGYVAGNLKPRSVLITEYGIAKVSDRVVVCGRYSER